jgi:hypothetical protein
MGQNATAVFFHQWRAQRKRQVALFAVVIGVFATSLFGSFIVQAVKWTVTETSPREYVLLIDGSPHAALRGAPLRNRSITLKQYNDWIFYERLTLALALLGGLDGVSFFALVGLEIFLLSRSGMLLKKYEP